MNKDKFKQDIQLLVITKGVPKSQHVFSPMEDTAAYYCALTNKSNKDYLDLVVTKLNVASGKKLKVSSFNSRIANMSFEIYKKGLERNSEQGKTIANYIKKFMEENQMNSIQLKECINYMFGRELV
jgi:hypothetical protein